MASLTIYGWVEKIYKTKKYAFIQLRKSATDRIQVLVNSDLIRETKIPDETFLQVTGTLQSLPPNKKSFSDHELVASDIKIIGISDCDFSSQCPPTANFELKLTKRHLYLRQPEASKIILLRAILLKSIREYFFETKCVEIIPPCFTGVECEGGATLFNVQHPGKSQNEPMTSYLTQSSQFALEMAVPAVGNCYCIYPSFRAEHSHTRRHLTEFLHVEAEWSCILSLKDHLDKLQEMLQGILARFIQFSQYLLEKNDPKLWERLQILQTQCKNIIPLNHKDAIKMCNERGFLKETDDGKFVPFDERDDIPEKQERALIDSINSIVFLVGFPREFKSFYMALDPQDTSRVLGCDVEVPGVGEIIGSGIRETNYENLQKRLIESNLKPEDYQEYLELRKYGFGQTSGMGLGVDRMLMWLLNIDSIREIVTYPRFPGYLKP